jgi:flagellar biogenesis protein FliO
VEFWLRYALALGVVALMLAACAVAGRMLRGAPQRASRRLTLLETLALGPQSALHLVRVDARDVLVGSGAGLVVELVDRVEAAVGEVQLVVEGDDRPLRHRT